MKYKKIAEELNVSIATIRNWIKTGLISENDISKLSQEEIKKKIILISKSKLLSRANKFSSKKTFIPVEYFSNSKNQYKFQVFYDYLNSLFTSEETENKLFLSAIYVSKLHNFFKKKDSLHIILENLKNRDLKNNIQKELSNWYSQINFRYSIELEKIFDFSFPEENDFLGILYQSLKSEGEKSKKGSYYTPKNIVDEIVSEYLNKNFKVLDPACGTGQFLLAFASKISNPKMIYGFDNDHIAVKIARINLILKFKNKKFTPNIFEQDSLLNKKEEFLKSFDLIATNPPWGAHFTKKQKHTLKSIYPNIKSFESASYFIAVSKDYLKENGIMSFILPISILNVKIHEDIRKLILASTKILKIIDFNKIFKNVFTDVIRIDMQKKSKQTNNQIIINNKTKIFKIQQQQYLKTEFHTFTINTTSNDFELLNKIYSIEHTSLKDQAKFALGIVTGNNKKHISDIPLDGYEAVITGKEVQAFKLKESNKYIKFNPTDYQQVSPEYLYRTKEKLIYKFISNKLVFSFDDKKRLTLNSANILIPQIPNYDIRVILTLLNSSLYNFIFQKKYNSLKVLRSHIENLPIPILKKNEKMQLVNFSKKITKNNSIQKELDDYVFEIFKINKEEKKHFTKK